MRALTEQLYVDETEAAEDGLADLLDENAFHQAPMPGTSMRQPTANPNSGMNGPSPAMRPTTMAGRPITGMLRLNTQAAQGGKSMENALKTARTAATARPITTATGRFVRLGTVSDLEKFKEICLMSSHMSGVDVEYTGWSISSSWSIKST